LGLFFNESTIIDVNFCWQAWHESNGIYYSENKAKRENPSSLADTLELQANAIDYFKKTLEIFTTLTKKGVLHTKNNAYISFDLKDDKKTKLAAPLDRINCYRDFFTHEKHVKTGFEKRNEPIPEAWYKIPVFYKGATTGFIGTDDIVMWPSYTKKLDYELELAVVIGKAGKNIKEKNAYEHIFGFTILNDISARDIQKLEMSVRLGPAKSKDFCSVIGPVIVTADEFNYTDPDLLMQARINGSLWSEGRSKDAHYSWGEMIAHLSQDEWVLPTDFLGSGTVGTGCGLELDKWIQPSDLVELEIEKIGILKNIIGIPNQAEEK
jgi:2-keto-4-pentenoate hydratase/2-oxohepta-3-ene-1,7-dioic acid hydratase in catechol pathway